MLFVSLYNTNIFSIRSSGGFYISKFGTICEVLEATHNEETVTHNTVIIKSRTRYRFRILDDIKKSPMPMHGSLS